MAFQFGDLNDETRRHMLAEVNEATETNGLYFSERMTSTGKGAYPGLLRKAVQHDTEQTLTRALQRSERLERV